MALKKKTPQRWWGKINFCSTSFLISNIPTLGTCQIVVQIFTFCYMSLLIFNIQLFLKFI